MVGVRPGQDEFHRQSRQGEVVSGATVLREEGGQRRPTGQASVALAESVLYRHPGFTRGAEDGAGPAKRPASRAGSVGIRPPENLLDAQVRDGLDVADATLRRQQPGEG